MEKAVKNNSKRSGLMSKIAMIKAYELYDSRGNPTVAVKVVTEKGGVLKIRRLYTPHRTLSQTAV